MFRTDIIFSPKYFQSKVGGIHGYWTNRIWKADNIWIKRAWTFKIYFPLLGIDSQLHSTDPIGYILPKETSCCQSQLLKMLLLKCSACTLVVGSSWLPDVEWGIVKVVVPSLRSNSSHPQDNPCLLLGTLCAPCTHFTMKTNANKKIEAPYGLGCSPE